ncbi:hypothetical protein [Photorhabdus sp. RW14-46]|nr:hypothetical protein [Photorhabdus sp. RW14-46]
MTGVSECSQQRSNLKDGGYIYTLLVQNNNVRKSDHDETSCFYDEIRT